MCLQGPRLGTLIVCEDVSGLGDLHQARAVLYEESLLSPTVLLEV